MASMISDLSELLAFEDDLILPDKPRAPPDLEDGTSETFDSSDPSNDFDLDLSSGTVNMDLRNMFDSALGCDEVGEGEDDQGAINMAEFLSFNNQEAFNSGKREDAEKWDRFVDEDSEDFDICLDTDLSWPLSWLRPRIAKSLGEQFSKLPFWLSSTGTDMADSTKLSEHCTTDQGPVKVKLLISGNKINIVDVLSTSDSHPKSPPFSKSPQTFIKEEIVDVSSNNAQFMESMDFLKLREQKHLPRMSEWTVAHTKEWLRWVRHTFTGVRMDMNDWNLAGRELMALTRESFRAKVRHDPDFKLWLHFDQLRTTDTGIVPVELENVKQSLPLPLHAIDSRHKIKKPKVVLGKYEQGTILMNIEEGSGVNRTGNNGISTQLWKFLLEILTDKDHRHIIHWVTGSGCEEGEFLMKEPESVARLWGKRKGKENMNYEKLSRALRYYKGGDILDKVKGKRFTYRFVCNLRQLVGYSANQLDRLVRN